MHGGVILFRGSGADARRYVEADRSRADDYYQCDSSGIEYKVLDASGEVTVARSLTNAEYNGWVDWLNPDGGESMGKPCLPGTDRLGSPRFAEMVINTPKSLSIAAALHPEISGALDAAQQAALSEIQRWLAQHSVTRVGSRGKQEVMPVEHMQIVGITHRTSRAGDPHRHIHMQIGTRVWAAGKWRALDTAAMFKQQGAIRALGAAVIAASPELAEVLDRHGLTLDPVTGEATELEPFNALMSKRGKQVRRNLERLETEWEARNPGAAMGSVVSARLTAQAWAYERPAKKPATLRAEGAWLAELKEAGLDPGFLTRSAGHAHTLLDDLSIQAVANRALDRCSAAASTWTPHTIQEHATRLTTEAGVRATREELREFITLATGLAVEDCFSVLPPGAATPEHVAHLTSTRVVAAEISLRDLLHALTPVSGPALTNIDEMADAAGLDAGQTCAAAAVASTDPLVIVEGAAGAGKTMMLGVAIRAATERGGATRVVAPTLRAAQAARQELGVPAASLAALVHAHGWRWNKDGAWTRLADGDFDPGTGRTYTGPPKAARLTRGERVIVDEAGMLDQDTARAILTVCNEAGATVALVGDRAQLPAVGRGGVLDIAAQIRGQTFDMAEVHRFTDPAYADVTLQMRDGANPGEMFEQLRALGLLCLHDSPDGAYEQIAQVARDGQAITVATNDEAAALNDRIRTERVARGEVDDVHTTTGSDGLNIGAGDRVQTRHNDTALGVANRQTWTVQHVEKDGTLWVGENNSERKRARTVALPAEYVAMYTHLAYASTAYGAQGATVGETHTILSDAMSAAGIYVGMTRGRNQNTLHIIAANATEARDRFTLAMERDRADRGLDHATQHATEEVRWLTANGPVKLVNDKIAQLTRQADRAERDATKWLGIAERLDQQRTTHRAENDEGTGALHKAEEHAARMHAEIAQLLAAQAEADGADYLGTVAHESETRARLTTVGWFGKHKAKAEYRAATEQTEQSAERVRKAWGEPPQRAEALPAWASDAAIRRAERNSRVIEAAQAVEAAQTDQESTNKRHENERLGLLAKEHGADRVHRDRTRTLLTDPPSEARKARAKAAAARGEANVLRGLPLHEAASRIEARRAGADAAREAAAERVQRLRGTAERKILSSDPRRDGLRLDL